MRARSVSLAVVVAALGITAPAASATTFTVNSLGDQSDASLAVDICEVSPLTPGDECTLRAAIEQANASSAAAPHKIHFALGAGATIPVNAAELPAVTRAGTEIDGCSAGTQTTPCVGLRSSTGAGTGLEVDASGVTVRGLAISNFTTGIFASAAGLIVRNSDFGIGINGTTVDGMDEGVLLTSSGARIGGTEPGERNVFAGNEVGLAIVGGDLTGVYGNWFGQRRDGAVVGNARGVLIAGVALPNGTVVDQALDNVVGDGSAATDDEFAFCAAACNVIAGSSIAGVDLAGTPALGQAASGDSTISGNWIGLNSAGGQAGNTTGVLVGDAGVSAGVMIGGVSAGEGNLISGNDVGIDQSGGQGVLNVFRNLFGADPDQDTAMPNTDTNAVLAGDVAGHEALVIANHFGATAAGLVLTGPQACVSGNFFTPFDGTYGDAAVILESGADSVRVGNNVPCVAGFSRSNAFGGTAADVPAVLIRGADDVRVQANFVGALPFAAPLAGPPIRVVDGPGSDPATGAQIGSDDDNLWNALIRVAGPAVEVDGHATGIVVAGNEGFAVNDFNSASSLFTDLLSTGGLGNTPGGQNAGIQPPVIGTATNAGMSGTGTPGATIRPLQQWRADNPADDVEEPFDEGYTLPTVPATTMVAADGTWSLAFAERLPEGQKLTASQTTANGSSEYAAVRTSTRAPDLPIALITGGPTGTIAEKTATFTFSTPTPGATLECGIDGAPFAPCTSPMTVGPLEQGAHQFRVQARLGSQASLPVSRNWTIELPAAPAPASPKPTATAAVRFATVVSLPSNRRCVSRRLLRMRLRKPAGLRIVFAEIRIKGKRTKTVSGRALAAAIDLRGLPKGTVRVRVRVVLSNGKVISGSRTYRTCAAKKKKKATKRR